MRVKPQLTPLERAIRSAELALDKKAEEVRILEIGHLTTIADYMVIANGRSDKQVQAIADSVRQGLKKYGKVLDIEGMEEGKWVVVDYGDVLIHVFHEDLRRYYDLDQLWNMAVEVPVPEPKPAPVKKG
jgi:ribosome-associated protein